MKTLKEPYSLGIVKAIHSAANISSFLMMDWLDSSLLENGFFRSEADNFDVRAAIQELPAVLGPHIKCANNQVKVWFSSKVPQKVNSDKNRMQ